jgi:hypothetical protein
MLDRDLFAVYCIQWEILRMKITIFSPRNTLCGIILHILWFLRIPTKENSTLMKSESFENATPTEIVLKLNSNEYEIFFSGFQAQKKVRTTNEEKEVNTKGKTVWYLDKLCPKCGNRVATNGQEAWCSNMGCNYCTY